MIIVLLLFISLQLTVLSPFFCHTLGDKLFSHRLYKFAKAVYIVDAVIHPNDYLAHLKISSLSLLSEDYDLAKDSSDYVLRYAAEFDLKIVTRASYIYTISSDNLQHTENKDDIEYITPFISRCDINVLLPILMPVQRNNFIFNKEYELFKVNKNI